MCSNEFVRNDEIEKIVIQIVNYIASDVRRLEEFVAVSGIDKENLINCLYNSDTYGFIINYLMQNESELLSFCENFRIDVDRMKSLHECCYQS